jgi:hypothetical protein
MIEGGILDAFLDSVFKIEKERKSDVVGRFV